MTSLCEQPNEYVFRLLLALILLGVGWEGEGELSVVMQEKTLLSQNEIHISIKTGMKTLHRTSNEDEWGILDNQVC